MVKCVFCGREESPYKGVYLLANDGSVNFYCSSKCRKNALNLKRDKKKLKWTEAYRITREKAAVAEVKAGERAKAAEERKAEKEQKEEKSEKK